MKKEHIQEHAWELNNEELVLTTLYTCLHAGGGKSRETLPLPACRRSGGGRGKGTFQAWQLRGLSLPPSKLLHGIAWHAGWLAGVVSLPTMSLPLPNRPYRGGEDVSLGLGW